MLAVVAVTGCGTGSDISTGGLPTATALPGAPITATQPTETPAAFDYGPSQADYMAAAMATDALVDSVTAQLDNDADARSLAADLRRMASACGRSRIVQNPDHE